MDDFVTKRKAMRKRFKVEGLKIVHKGTYNVRSPPVGAKTAQEIWQNPPLFRQDALRPSNPNATGTENNGTETKIERLLG